MPALAGIEAAWGVTAGRRAVPGSGGGGPARGGPRDEPLPGHGRHRRDRPGHVPVPHGRAPGLLGRARPVRPPVRQPVPQAGQGKGQLLPARLLHPGRQRAARTETFLGERLRRLSKRIGGARARCAVARSILVIVWHLLKDPSARYADLGPDWHQRKTDRDKKAGNCLRQLRALGYDVTVTDLRPASGQAAA